MKILKTTMDGVFVINNFVASDSRGAFIKLFNEADFLANGLQTEFKESYYSISNKNVIRGMHFQLPPFDHEKLVHVISGSVIDVVLDLRTKSSTYGKALSIKLDDIEKHSIYIPVGCAHGFRALEDNTTMLYYVASGYNKESDYGILWNSIDFDWKITNPLLSDRDKTFIPLKDFKSPF